MQTIEYLSGTKSVSDYANIKNKDGSTALDIVERCPNRDRKTVNIREILVQAGVLTSICGGSDPNPESPPDNSAPPPYQRWCKAARVILRCIYRFWVKYFKADHIWLQQVLSSPLFPMSFHSYTNTLIHMHSYKSQLYILSIKSLPTF